jgi:O-antigen ligase
MNKKNILWYLLSFTFILNLSVGMISNFSTIVFVLKIFCSLFLFFLISIDIKINQIKIKELLREQNPKYLMVVLASFTGYLLITVTYSKDPIYGLQKILNFLTITIPLIIAFYYFLITHTEEKLRVFINALVIITFISLTLILIEYPFQPGLVYEFKPNRWSQVIYGRIIGLSSLALLLYSIRLNNYKSAFFYSFFSALAAYALFLSTHRSSLISLGIMMVVVGGSLVVGGKRGEVRGQNINPIISLLTVIGLTLVLIFILPKPEIVSVRYNNLAAVEELNFGGDGPILSRIEALKLSWQMFLDNPVFGVGFGGFKAYNSVTEFLKYPHNIFIEMAVEGGIVGLLVLSAMLYVLFRSVYRFTKCHPEFISGSGILPLASYSLLLALFSKDLSSQTVLWIFIAFMGMSSVRGSKSKV